MAWRAGALVSDLEFVQFHPTVLHASGAPRFLISEAVRGEGARLLNASGEPFMMRYDPRGDLAPRDVVATAMVREAARTGHTVLLSLAHMDAVWARERFPGIAEACRRAGLDLARDPLPVSPAAHYLCGGVVTDLEGRTSIAGLFAAGEVACTRVHGANRLASNSLLEGLVFGARAAAAMRDRADGIAALPDGTVMASEDDDSPPSQRAATNLAGSADTDDVSALMWQAAGLVRDHNGLAPLVARLAALAHARDARADSARNTEDWRLANLARVGWLIARAALRRTESRGGHRRADFPERDDLHWKVHLAEQRSKPR
jgi:L-aspartate oxidase